MLLLSLLVSFTSCYCHSPRLIFGSPLEWERTTDITASMLCPPALAQKGHKHYQCFTRDFWMRHNLCFLGKGKKSFWQAWMAFEEVTDTFVYLASHPFEPLDSNCENFRKIERLIVLVYDKTSTSVSINQTRRELFCLKNITMERMPPTQNALLQHTKRAVYQASIWVTSTEVQQMIPSPSDYGWGQVDNVWGLLWLTVPELSKACQDLIKCTCKGDCSNCKCGKANLKCSPLCNCNCNSYCSARRQVR